MMNSHAAAKISNGCTYAGPRPLSPIVACLLALCAWFTAPAANGQESCSVEWHSTNSLPGVRGNVYALTYWDPDGTGPRSAALVAGGDFLIAGNILVNRIAMWDPDLGRWVALSSGLSETVRCLAVLPNGDLVAGGDFYYASGQTVWYVARWDGITWSSLGEGLGGSYSNSIYALVVLPNGDLVAGGRFPGTTPSGGYSPNIAKWNGTTWSGLGTGTGSPVRALAAFPNGDVLVGGDFIRAGATGATHIARWDGANWSALGSGLTDSVNAVAVMPEGTIVAGGSFVNGALRIAQFTGGAWSTMGAGFNDSPTTLVVRPNGELVAGGNFVLAGPAGYSRVARWDGATWRPIGATAATSSASSVRVLMSGTDGSLVVGGTISAQNGDLVGGAIAQWNGEDWSPIGPGINESVTAMVTRSNGEVVAGGAFTFADGRNVRRVASWNGSSWSPLGTGMNNVVAALTILPGGDLIAGGSFTTAGGLSVNRVARWDGSSWFPLGDGMTGGSLPVVNALAVLPDGDLVAAGKFTTAGQSLSNNIARWDGSAWHALGSGTNNTINALAVLPGGDLVAAGSFTIAGGEPVARVARWTGAAWSQIGDGLNGQVYDLAVLPDGGLAAAGVFTLGASVGGGSVAKWDGETWTALGTGMNFRVQTLAVLRNGDLVAGGGFAVAEGSPARGVARWNGREWVAVDGGVRQPVGPSTVYSLYVLPDGDLLLSGDFSIGGETVSPYFIRCTIADCPPCPADFNRDGGVDGADVESFYVAWEAGDSVADVNRDGGVDGGDVEFFVVTWEAGGC